MPWAEARGEHRAALKDKGWLLALGQEQLDDQADQPFAIGVRDRFPSQLSVHLAATKIRDVVHKRLLQKTPAATRQLTDLFERHRAALEELRRRNLATYSQKEGYKIQCSAGEEWERRDIGAPRETISEMVQEALKV